MSGVNGVDGVLYFYFKTINILTYPTFIKHPKKRMGLSGVEYKPTGLQTNAPAGVIGFGDPVEATGLQVTRFGDSVEATDLQNLSL
jgi:hypothetical protein